MNLEIIERINAVKEHRLPAGYRHPSYTDSVLPADWPDCQIKDIVKQVIRPVARPDKPYWRLGLRSHAKGTFHEWVEEPEKVEMGTLFEVKENDLILNITFAWEHAVGLIQKKDEICLVSHRFPTYEFINGNIPEFFFAVVCQPWFKKMLADISPGGAGRNRVMSKPNFLCLPCFCPPLQEQQKIAEILSACERVLTLKKELKAQKIKQKKWLMQKLLNPVSGVRLPGFMSEWETVTLGDLFDFSTSLSASRDKLGTDGIPYLHYGDIHKSSQTFIDVAMDWEKLPKLKIGEIQDKYLLKDGDVVFVDASEDYEGASKYVVIYNPENRPFLAGLHTLPAHSKTDRLDRQFKRFCFQSHSVKTQVMFYLSGMKVYGLNRENIGKIKLSLPSLAEQSAIAEVLSAADRELDLLEEEIQAWERKKKALSQLLLLGIVRV